MARMGIAPESNVLYQYSVFNPSPIIIYLSKWQRGDLNSDLGEFETHVYFYVILLGHHGGRTKVVGRRKVVQKVQWWDQVCPKSGDGTGLHPD